MGFGRGFLMGMFFGLIGPDILCDSECSEAAVVSVDVSVDAELLELFCDDADWFGEGMDCDASI